MASPSVVKIGFISASAATGPHFEPFRRLTPSDIEYDFEGLGLGPDSLYVPAERLRAVLQAARNVEERGCQGLVVSGAPAEVMNPDLPERLRATVGVPSATALTASVAALQAFGAQRVLLLTPFDPATNQKIRDHLATRAIVSVSPATAFGQIDEAMRLTPDEVYQLTAASVAAAGEVDAIYFQGAVLDPLEVMERIEHDFGHPVVASNPAMLWFILSQLGRTYHIDGHGALLRDWPAVSA